MSGTGGLEWPGSPAEPADGPWAQGPARARRRVAAPWPRMACAAPLSFAVLLSCTEVGPVVDAPAAWKGPGSVSMEGNSLIAAPYAPGAFERWEGAPCDGVADPVCELPETTGPAAELPEAATPTAMPVASFRPFVVAGVKSLAFGLGYHKAAGSRFRVRARGALGTSLSPVPGLERLDPGGPPARLEVSVHLLPWGLGGYVTEACGVAGCVVAPGGEQTLAQADSVAATGYLKAPNAGAYDEFGHALALSADGSTLAVGADYEGSSATGAFAPGDPGYQAALDSDGANSSGAAYVHRRSTGGRWVLEAFIKAPVAGDRDLFGHALALSADGSTLAVGADSEDSSATGAFAPGDPGYRAALDDDGAENSGAAYVHRRSTAGRWTLEVFVKAPVAGYFNFFGSALALSADGLTLAVGARFEDSAATSAFAPDDPGYRAALDDDGANSSGAAYVHRRSVAARWTLEAFVKAPVAGYFDFFGSALALSADGSTLAVGADHEGSSAAGVFAPGDPGYRAALDDNGARYSGAVYVHRRSASDRWALEAFLKPPVAGGVDRFGSALALSADGSTLAVGAHFEDSSATGAFAPGDDGYQAALDSDGGYSSGATYVHRRSAASRWALEAFLKSPVAAREHFGTALALSADGSTLAVGADGKDSSATGTFAPGGAGYQVALGSDGTWNSGAVYVHHRSTAGRWTTGNFVKAPNADAGDSFGAALALSADGSALAVGAFLEDGSAQPWPVVGGSSDTGNAAEDSGAVYLY